MILVSEIIRDKSMVIKIIDNDLRGYIHNWCFILERAIRLKVYAQDWWLTILLELHVLTICKFSTLKRHDLLKRVSQRLFNSGFEINIDIENNPSNFHVDSYT